MFLLILESFLRVFGSLLLFSAVVLPFAAALLGIVMPSARVALAVIESSHARLSVLLVRSRILFPLAILSAITLCSDLGCEEASRAVLEMDHPGAKAVSDAVTVALFYLWATHGMLSTAGFNLLISGFEEADADRLRWRVQRQGMSLLPVAGVVAWQLPGPYGSLGIVMAVVLISVNVYYALRGSAEVRRQRAHRARDLAPEGEFGSSWILHISDVHATAERVRRADGGADGTPSLEAFTNVVLRSSAPRFILVTGDVIDHGTGNEWEGILPFMWKLRRAGHRILIAPGNHDLATAYEPSVAERFGSLATSASRPVDARKLVSFLDHAAELEPELQSWEGTLLSRFVHEVRSPVTNLEAAWRAVREQALGTLRNDPLVDGWVMRRLKKQGPRQVFRHLRISDYEDARRIMGQFIDQAEGVFRRPGTGPWTRAERERFAWVVLRSADWSLPATLLGSHWMDLWYKPFPLRLVVAGEQIEFLLLNSNAPEPGLLGSAFGRLGGDQIERLRTAVSRTPARRLVVLMHHPICGWTTERADQPDSPWVSASRWAMLAHDSVEARELPQLLETAAPATCRQVFLCCGHRHGLSRAGPALLDSAASVSSRLWVLESAALVDLHGPKRRFAANNGLLALRKTDGAELKVGRIPWGATAQ